MQRRRSLAEGAPRAAASMTTAPCRASDPRASALQQHVTHRSRGSTCVVTQQFLTSYMYERTFRQKQALFDFANLHRYGRTLLLAGFLFVESLLRQHIDLVKVLLPDVPETCVLLYTEIMHFMCTCTITSVYLHTSRKTLRSTAMQKLLRWLSALALASVNPFCWRNPVTSYS